MYKKPPLKRKLVGNQKNLPAAIKEEIFKAGPLKRRFCGGKSKLYKK